MLAFDRTAVRSPEPSVLVLFDVALGVIATGVPFFMKKRKFRPTKRSPVAQQATMAQ
jgi:hypothetical protein